MKTITITIDPQGQLEIQAHGYRGRACRDATRTFERMLGKVQSRQLKPEYYQTQSTGTAQSIQPSE